ncbi:hypothetical protein vseg_008940 [Gypsophila vaccaria]
MSFSCSSTPCITSTLLTLILVAITPTLAVANETAILGRHRQMSVDYYAKSCPQVEKLVSSITSQMIINVPFVAPATIRLFFHDCFVQGCDASILISTKPGSGELAERDAIDNKEFPVEAFDGIDKAKALLESKCPGVVSCADILAISARDYVNLTGGPYYEVKKGRWDGKKSKASEVFSNLPRANSTMDEVIKLFNSKGLTTDDLVILSGAHSIGYTHCKYITNRLYDYKGTKQPQPNLDPRLLKALTMYCPKYGGNEDIVVPFDVTTPYKFDHVYYSNLEGNLGILETDQALFLDPRTKSQVQMLASNKDKFFQAFAIAMEKMGSIHVKRGQKHGEKRVHCSLHM